MSVAVRNVPATIQINSNQVKIRILYWHWGRGGAGSKFTYELAKATAESGVAKLFVSAVAGHELSELIRGMRPSPPICDICTFTGRKDTLGGKLAALTGLAGLPRIGRQFEAFVREHNVEVVVCTMHSIWDLAVLPVLRRMGVPFVLFVHDARPHPGDGYPFRETSIRWEIAGADGIVVLSEHVRQQVIRVHGVPTTRIWTVPHGAFEFGARSKREAPRGRPARLLFFGRILEYKGLGLLLDAFRQLLSEGVAVELEVVGSGDLAPYAAQLRSLQGVFLTNRWVEDWEVGPALARTDVMVLPYREASQSGVAAAAASAGMPAIATPVGGLAEQVRDGDTGLVADAVSSDALAAAIRRLLEEPGLYSRCSEGALRYSREELGWQSIARRLIKIAAEVNELRRSRAPA